MNIHTPIRIAFFILLTAAIGPQTSLGQAQSARFSQLKSQAEKLVTDRSYSRANDLYRQAGALPNLNSAERRWVDFRLADTSWRSQAGTQTNDSTVYDRARQQLESLINNVQRQEDRDLTWAEAHQSLGDFWWSRQDSQNWHQGWTHYQQALDWWAGSGDMETARNRYLQIVWTMAEPAWMQRGNYGYSSIPIEILDNALKIAVEPGDQARLHFLVAMTLRNDGDLRQQLRMAKEFEAALAANKTTDWYDDALFAYAEWLMNNGRVVVLENGQWTREPDYVRAMELFQKLLREFKKGETRYWDQAAAHVKQITDPRVGVSVSNIFLPGSEIQFHVNWRNVKRIDFALHKVDLPRDLKLPGPDGIGQWADQVELQAAERVRTWVKDTQDKDDHRPGQSVDRLDEPLPIGAYILEATAGAARSRDVVFVTDAAVILKTAGDQALAYACDALNGAPLPNATVRIWKLVHLDNRWRAGEATKQTDDQGLCVFNADDFPAFPQSQYAQYIVVAKTEDRQAVAVSYSNAYTYENQQWRIYAFTDRPAYRPAEIVQWKIIARAPGRNGFQTPANQTIYYQISDPQGSKVAEGPAVLNAFGSAWGSLELTSAMPLGEYRVNYWKSPNQQNHIGQATLFRLEEYKLPEFQVSISTPEENGRKKAFVLGDYVQADIQADYYFGGPVANANVEVVVYQSPHYHWWTPHRDYPWVYEDSNPYRWWGGGQGQIIRREQLKTDRTGKAVLTFETPANSQQDFEYRIEARVIDASRREITASDSVRVTRQRYYVHMHPQHNLHWPNDKVEIDIKALDANDQPMPVEGTVNVTREQWVEIWIDPTGQEVTGAALRVAQQDLEIWPPVPPHPGSPPWRLKFRGYQSEDVLTTKVKLDEKGEATFAFTAQKEGYFRVRWNSQDHVADFGPMPITSETYVWVATDRSTELGYRQGGLQIVVDKDTFRAGQTAPVMVSTPTNDRYVLLAVEGNDLYSYQIVHVSGTAKLVQLQIDQRHIPNVYLTAHMAHDGQLYQHQEQVFVPPVQQYLKVDVTADRPAAHYQPGDEGSFTIKTTDHDGKPISAEVALAVADESVTYIQQDYAGDPRPFFFDRRQSLYVQTGSTFQQKGFVKLVKWQNDQLIDQRLRSQMEQGRDALGKDDEMYGERMARNEYATKSRSGGGGGYLADGAAEMDGVAGAPRPATAQLGMPLREMAADKRMQAKAGQAPMEEGHEPAVVVRSDFRATLLWHPNVTTDEGGLAKVTLKYADTLTSWKAVARAAGKFNQFGMGSATTRTKLPLIARLQAPRFFLIGDTVTISGVINNNTDVLQSVTPKLEAVGLDIIAMTRKGQPVKRSGRIDVPANGEARVDWQIGVSSLGNQTAKLKFTAASDKYADAMEKTFAIYEHGVERFVAKSGKVRGNDVSFKLDIPSERKIESTALMVQVSPSMAVTMIDALPYLIDYPYGCTEQTMSRFLPAAITAKTLRDLGIRPETAMSRVFGGIEQANVGKTHPKGKKDLAKLDEITQASLARLYDFQHADGGWGWWKECDSDHFMTSYVLWGLCLAKDAGLDVRQDAIDRAASYLNSEIVEEETAYDQQAWMLHALACYHASTRRAQIGEFQAVALKNLWNNRDKLNAYTRALLALSAHNFGDKDKAQTLIDNLENGVKRDDRPDASVIVKGVDGPNEAVMGTAHCGEDGIWWRWSDGGVEATAFALRAILAIDPQNKLVEPITNWLIKNRRGAQWSNTRDTAIVVLAMNDYLRATGELSPQLEYELLVNGKSIAKKQLSAEDALSAPSQFEIDRQHIRDGANDIRIVRTKGTGPIYFAAQATFFSLEEPVPPAGNEIFVRREYFKLVPRPTLLKGYVYDRFPLGDGGTVASGERVEVVMTVESKNNYDYLVFEDLKPAGLEAVAVRSGEPLHARQMKQAGIERAFGVGRKNDSEVLAELAQGDAADYTGDTRNIYQELRDRKIALFLDRLPEGVWEIRYDLRAETPGRFHALPVMGHAMYVPEIRANSAEIRLSVIDTPTLSGAELRASVPDGKN
ncbi:MAG: MG2 domain-containing protein [Phycisphaerales bacterium]|nr:MG2 domain-containing protein [Phycisphaerales bacterium]